MLNFFIVRQFSQNFCDLPMYFDHVCSDKGPVMQLNINGLLIAST